MTTEWQELGRGGGCWSSQIGTAWETKLKVEEDSDEQLSASSFFFLLNTSMEVCWMVYLTISFAV